MILCGIELIRRIEKIMILSILGKFGPYPAVNGGTSSYLIQSEKANVLLDCGSGALSRIQNFIDINSLDAIVLSHLHNDHICDLLPLSYFLSKCKKNIKLFMPLTECPQYDIISQLEGFDIEPIFNYSQISIKNLIISFYEMQHSIESYAVKITDGATKLFYSGDTVFNEAIFKYADGCENLLLDCALPANLSKGSPHMSINEGILIGERLKARVLVTHINPEHSVKAQIKDLKDVQIVEEMTRYRV